MIFKLNDNPTFKIRGWCMHIRVDGFVMTYSSLYKEINPNWYTKGTTQVICPSMMEGWSDKLLTARQV